MIASWSEVLAIRPFDLPDNVFDLMYADRCGPVEVCEHKAYLSNPDEHPPHVDPPPSADPARAAPARPWLDQSAATAASAARQRVIHLRGADAIAGTHTHGLTLPPAAEQWTLASLPLLPARVYGVGEAEEAEELRALRTVRLLPTPHD